MSIAIVHQFLDAATDEFLADIFIVIETASRSAMTGCAEHFIALTSFVGYVLVYFFRDV